VAAGGIAARVDKGMTAGVIMPPSPFVY